MFSEVCEDDHEVIVADNGRKLVVEARPDLEDNSLFGVYSRFNFDGAGRGEDRVHAGGGGGRVPAGDGMRVGGRAGGGGRGGGCVGGHAHAPRGHAHSQGGGSQSEVYT